MAVQLLFRGMFLPRFFNVAGSILVQLPSCFFYIRLVWVHVVHPYSRIDTTAAWKKLHSILSDRSDFYMIDNLSIALRAFASRLLMSFSVDETLLPRFLNLSTNFRELPNRVEIKTHVLDFVSIDAGTKATCCLLQTMQQGFGLGRCICKNHYDICVVWVRNSLLGVSSASCLFFFFFFLVKSHFLSLDLSMFEERSRGIF